MSDDVGRERHGGAPAQGNRGPVDPTADPATDPGLRPVPGGPSSPATQPPATTPPAEPPTPPAVVRHSRTGVLWIGLILSALVLLLLLVFIVQNQQYVQIVFFALDGMLPLGVALLLAAIAGILLGAIPGSLRIMQLRRAARRGTRTR